MLAKSVAQYLFIIAILGLTIATSPATLQAQSSVITPNPDAQPLRKIWELGGRMVQRMGSAFGSIGDINGDSLDDFGVYSGLDHTWRLFLGNRDSLSRTPFQTWIGSSDIPPHPTLGRFWGTRPALGLSHYIREQVGASIIAFFTLEIFRTDSFRLDTVPSLVLDMRKMTPRIWTAPLEIIGYDLDHDGYDEMILFFQGIQRDSSIDRHPQVWIYRGGPNFQVDSPTVIIRDAEEQDDYGFQMYIGRFDDDPYPDLLYGFLSSTSGSRLAIYFGRDGSPWNWTAPDRTLNVGELTVLDCNGDSVLDLAEGKPSRHVSVYLSGAGKSLRTRSLMLDDVDLDFEGTVGIFPGRHGYLSDSARRFELLGIQDGRFDMEFSGGPPGPDFTYDAYSNDLLGNRFTRPLGDVTGDGWDDLMTGYFGYDNYNGIARVFAGGPYIPRDPSSGVRTVATDERSDAIHLWPNPVTAQLHIAWRGDLKRMPRMFVIHDIRGSEIARGTVESWRGEAIWNCTDVPAGNYLLSIYDYTNALMTTTPITKY
jgi:hypothetical protein